ncbi:unnamed protein product [Microthlaspi erraticum]|uniref:Aminotransferase-like plant mobile domain-containing protein n=1 Tax=Microthlaspi erraticum TaxID=1685480 RepID=A0A6D2JWA6_9BRAS|nr:unnamed protein product [Microthlaspi erraticum]
MDNASSSSSQPTENSLIEEREEVMLTDKGPTLRKTHFLKPFVTSIDCSGVAELPHQRLSVSSTELNRLSKRNSFSGFWVAERHFVSWLGKMEALHGPIWRKAGIFEAIKASTYSINKNLSLIFSVAEKWCPKTKSFVFPWGEATITLEDVTVLLGFSVLGSSAFAPLEMSEMRNSVEKLEKEWKRMMNVASKGSGVTQPSWITSFLGRGDDTEHEAFLVLWLSFFVFPYRSRRFVSRDVISIAVRLARGERIALAPAVLASVYRDLDRISGLGGEKSDKKVTLRSLFKLVQVWTWERFKKTRPNAREIPKGEPRIAQWDSLQQRSNLRFSFDAEDFDWRPYTKPLKNWNPLRFYVEEAMWVTVDDSTDDEFASFARFVTASQLAGDGFVEDYYPNRVAMQFGLAQDVPGSASHHHRSFTVKEAWDSYNRSLVGVKLYMPSRLDRRCVTERYRDWWVKPVSEFLGSVKMEKESTETFDARKTFDDSDDDDDEDLNASTKVMPLCEVVQKLEEGFLAKRKRSSKINSLVSSGWRSSYQSVQMKRGREEDGESSTDDEDDNMTVAERMRSRKKYCEAEESRGDASISLGKRRRKFQVVDSDDDDDDSRPCQKLASGNIEQKSDETASKAEKTRTVCDDVNGNTEEKESVIDDGTKESEFWLREDGEKQRCREVKKEEGIDESFEQSKLVARDIELKLEERILKVKKTLAMIREWKTRGAKIKVEVSP